VINCKLAIKRHFVEEEEIPKPEEETKESIKGDKLTKGNYKERINFSKIINTLNSNLQDIKVFGIN